MDTKSHLGDVKKQQRHRVLHKRDVIGDIYTLMFTVSSFLLVTPGAVPLNLTPGVSDPDQLDCLSSI